MVYFYKTPPSVKALQKVCNKTKLSVVLLLCLYVAESQIQHAAPVRAAPFRLLTVEHVHGTPYPIILPSTRVNTSMGLVDHHI